MLPDLALFYKAWRFLFGKSAKKDHTLRLLGASFFFRKFIWDLGLF
jgi:hypothetical protein